MKLYRKIDIYYWGKYVCSTEQSRTLKLAKARFYIKLIAVRGPSVSSKAIICSFAPAK